mmetsp:Transcript_25554/g.37926  ORF Transcript_25554/g.37926 Transcript_25554/m.37926 type:complete len:213 (-) Transcript_25554:425-1063(-)
MSGDSLHLFGLGWRFLVGINLSVGILLFADIQCILIILGLFRISISINISIDILKNLFFLLVIFHFHTLGLSDKNRVSDKLGIMMHQLLQPSKISIFLSIILQEKSNLSSSSKSIPPRILPNIIFILSIFRRPNMLLFPGGRFSRDINSVGNQKGSVETNSKHTNLTNLRCPLLNRIHEFSGTRISNGTKVIDELLLGHSNSTIGNSKSLFL